MSMAERRKELGVFYTDPSIASFLVTWAIRKPTDTILDPSFGDGVFLDAACERLKEIGGEPHQIHGVEIDHNVYDSVVSRLSQIPQANLIKADFFDVLGENGTSLEQPDIPLVDVVAGNPPFIRYQRFKGRVREKAMARVRNLGVTLNGLSSSWSPFLIHAASFLRAGGRLAMVVPAELMHASYAQPVLRFISQSFREVILITFRRRIFPDLSQDALLLLCDGFRHPPQSMSIVDLESLKTLKLPLRGKTPVSISNIVSGQSRLLEYLLPADTIKLYNRLKSSGQVIRLGDAAIVNIGYVTGNNDFFHLTKEDAETWHIPEEYLTPCVRTGSQLSGLLFTRHDWESLIGRGSANFLLDLSRASGILPSSVLDYIRYGERHGVHKSYKCRVRSPWYVVPHVYSCDGLLTYMSGKRAKLVSNTADVVAPNTLLIVRLKENAEVSMNELAVSWITSLTLLSTEIEGHSMGGGMLKLEPGEAQKTFIAIPDMSSKTMSSLVREVDELLRSKNMDEATTLVDTIILQNHLGLSAADIELLRKGALMLRGRRYNR